MQTEITTMKVRPTIDSVVNELLQLNKSIYNLGFIKTNKFMDYNEQIFYAKEIKSVYDFKNIYMNLKKYESKLKK